MSSELKAVIQHVILIVSQNKTKYQSRIVVYFTIKLRSEINLGNRENKYKDRQNNKICFEQFD